MALQELLMLVGRLELRLPLGHKIALLRRAKLILMRMYVIVSEYDSFFFSAILIASCFKVRKSTVENLHVEEITAEPGTP